MPGQVLLLCPLACGWLTICSVVPSVRMSNHVKMVLRLIGVGQHPKVYKVMDDPSPNCDSDSDSDFDSNAGKRVAAEVRNTEIECGS